jgi:hypothetical protein
MVQIGAFPSFSGINDRQGVVNRHLMVSPEYSVRMATGEMSGSRVFGGGLGVQTHTPS